MSQTKTISAPQPQRWMSGYVWDGYNVVAKPAPAVTRCECGSDSIGGGGHSDWCPKAVRP